jgi:uncharacterized membrane protein YidH (DUF202 family)
MTKPWRPITALEGTSGNFVPLPFVSGSVPFETVRTRCAFASMEMNMRNLMVIGVILIVVGIAALMIQNFHYTDTKRVADIGPLKINSEEQHNVPIPTIAGIVAVVAGFGLIFASRRST